MGGAGVHYWAAIAQRWGLDLTVVSEQVDPSFAFMTLDWDGQIRMDPSSAYAMQRLVAIKDRFELAFACDTDHDRHGIVTPAAGLLPPNHYLAVAVDYLFAHRPRWNGSAGVGKTVVSTQMIDRVAARLKRRLHEMPVGFKWFSQGLLDGSLGFAGEESAGAAFLRRDGTVWTTDKDGITAALLSRRDHGLLRSRSGGAVSGACRAVGQPGRRPHRSVGDAAAEATPGGPVADADRHRLAGGREDRQHAEPGTGQRRAHRRDQGQCEERLVRGATVGYRGHLRDLRRELPWRRPSAAPPG